MPRSRSARRERFSQLKVWEGFARCVKLRILKSVPGYRVKCASKPTVCSEFPSARCLILAQLHFLQSYVLEVEMSWFTDSSVLVKSDGNKDWWKTEYGPGDTVPVSGIYKCLGCTREVTCNASDPFPPQNHHQHSSAQGRVRWKLNVRTNTEGV